MPFKADPPGRYSSRVDMDPMPAVVVLLAFAAAVVGMTRLASPSLPEAIGTAAGAGAVVAGVPGRGR